MLDRVSIPWLTRNRCCRSFFTHDVLVNVASRDVKLALGEPLLDIRGVENVAGIAAPQEQDVGIDSLGQILSEAHSRVEAADVQGHRPFKNSRGMHRDVWRT